jgi:hypothetical protein
LRNRHLIMVMVASAYWVCLTVENQVYRRVFVRQAGCDRGTFPPVTLNSIAYVATLVS